MSSKCLFEYYHLQKIYRIYESISFKLKYIISNFSKSYDIHVYLYLLPRGICYCQHVINDVHPGSKRNIISFLKAILFFKNSHSQNLSHFHFTIHMFSNVTYPAPCGTVTNLRLNALIGGLPDLLSA